MRKPWLPTSDRRRSRARLQRLRPTDRAPPPQCRSDRAARLVRARQPLHESGRAGAALPRRLHRRRRRGRGQTKMSTFARASPITSPARSNARESASTASLLLRRQVPSSRCFWSCRRSRGEPCSRWRSNNEGRFVPASSRIRQRGRSFVGHAFANRSPASTRVSGASRRAADGPARTPDIGGLTRRLRANLRSCDSTLARASFRAGQTKSHSPYRPRVDAREFGPSGRTGPLPRVRK